MPVLTRTGDPGRWLARLPLAAQVAGVVGSVGRDKERTVGPEPVEAGDLFVVGPSRQTGAGAVDLAPVAAPASGLVDLEITVGPRADWLDAAEPYLVGGGATARVGQCGITWATGAARHEGGSPNVVGAVALAAARHDGVDVHIHRGTVGQHSALCASDRLHVRRLRHVGAQEACVRAE